MKLSQVEWKTVGKATLKEFSRDDVPMIAAAMAYHFLFALFPFAIFLAALTGFIGRFVGERDLFQTITNYLQQALPQTTWQAIEGPLTQVVTQQSGRALSLGVLLALFSASNGVATVMRGCNRAYGIEESRNFILQRLVAIALTVVLTLLLIAGFILLIFGGDIGGWLARQFGLGGAFQVVWNLLRYPLVLVGIGLALAILYWKGPNIDQQFEWITPGSVIATLAWFLATVGFGLYVQFFAAESFRNTYGAIAGLILFLFYLYLTSLVIMVGAEFNAETTKRYDPEVIREKVTDPGKQLPGKQPMPHPQALREAGVSRREVAAANGAPGAVATPDPFADPTVDERLRAIRARPAVSAEAQARREQAGLSATERARRARTTIAALVISAATAVAGVLAGVLRGHPDQQTR